MKLSDCNLGIIGAGKLGTVLIERLNALDKLDWIVEKSDSARESLDQKYGANLLVTDGLRNIPLLPEIIIITVPDSLIGQVSEELASLFRSRLENKHVWHCSGSLDANALRLCREQGAITACAHPYQTFYRNTKDILKNVAWGIEADESYDLISEFVTLLEGNPFKLTAENIKNKALYHCSAVVASNFLSAVLALSAELAEIAGIDAQLFLPPIVKATVDNNMQSIGREFPLTGPFARGDIETIKKHVTVLKDQPVLLDSYCHLGIITLSLADRYKIIDKQIVSEIHSFLLSLLNR